MVWRVPVGFTRIFAEYAGDVLCHPLSNRLLRCHKVQKVALQSGKASSFFCCCGLFVFNIVVKEQSAIVAFFEVIDTITENLVMGSIVTVLMGLGIVSVFTITKLYTQIISKTSSFRILENIILEEVAHGNWKMFGRRLLHFEDEPDPGEVVPEHLSSILISLSLLYLVSWVYVLLFSEALFFVSWSAGVDLTDYRVEYRIVANSRTGDSIFRSRDGLFALPLCSRLCRFYAWCCICLATRRVFGVPLSF